MLENFPNATSISITSGNALVGTLFAPFADLVDNGSGNIDGNVVARSVVFGVQPGGDAGEVHRRNALAFSVDWIDTAPTPRPPRPPRPRRRRRRRPARPG